MQVVNVGTWGQSTRPMKYPRIVRRKAIGSYVEKVECLECGKLLKQITWNHLQNHDLTIDAYKEKYHLPYGRGLTSEDTKKKKRERQNGLISLGKVKLISSNDPLFDMD